MTIKDQARKIIDSLPENSSMEDVMHAMYVHAKFSHGEKEIEAGKGVDHSEALKQMDSWRK